MKLTKTFSPSIALFSVAASLGVATVISSAAPASAISGPVTLGFVCNATSPASVTYACPVGTSQFSAVVSPVAGNTGQALFTFSNTGLAPSSITNISFLDPAQYSLGNVSGPLIQSSPSMFFTADPLVVGPGGVHQFKSASFGVTPGNNAYGINPGQSLGIVFNIANTPVPFAKPFNAVIADIYKKGLTIQITSAGFAFPGGAGSDASTLVTFNAKAPQRVPEPITMLGSAAALGFGALMKRRSSQLKAQKDGNNPVLATSETLV
jgi:hypothetical protein